jgi:hypothetical protein
MDTQQKSELNGKINGDVVISEGVQSEKIS